MLISWNWISDFVDLAGIDPESAAERLTMAGLEVAGVNKLCPESLSRVISAQIIAKEPHPEADKLSLCQVTDGQDEFTIVCGASNMQAGDFVALAPLKTRLPNGMTIKKAKIRGVVSIGMLCSASEMGFEDDSAGIMILPEDSPLGEPVVDLLGLQDTILEFEITPNRGDCLSVIGVAREIAAIYKRKFTLPKIDLQEISRKSADLAEITISDTDLCPRYVGRVVQDVVLGESPLWLKARLKSAGVRPISNVVDVSNYVMLETGQPLHAFDLDLLQNSRIDVRRAGSSNEFITLDEEERRIDPDTLMICDGQEPVAIAGIMGGLSSEINAATKNVLIESAFFQPASIRRSARVLNLGTEASYRFERGVDSEATVRAAARAAELLQNLAQGKVAAGAIDVCPQPRQMPEISFRPAKANAILGLGLDLDTIKDMLFRLDIEIVKESAGTLTVIPPAWRFDIEREVDLIEEVARLFGYDQVPVTAPTLSDPEVKDSPEVAALNRVRGVMLAFGYSEAVNYSFIDPQAVVKLNFAPESRFFDFVKLKNPISSEMAVMRTSLLPGLLTNLNDNLRVNVKNIRLFEVGRTFFNVAGQKQPLEELYISGVACGRRYHDHFSASDESVDFFDLKGVLEEVASALKLELNFVCENYFPCLTPGQAASIKLGDLAVGSVGQLDDKVAQAYGIDQNLLLFELALTPLLEMSAQAVTVYQGLARFPAVYRDLAFLVDKTIAAGSLLEYMRGQHKLLTAVDVFDLFQDDSLPAGKKSLAFRMTFQDMNKTLTDKKVNAIIAKLIKGIETTFHGEVR